MKTLYQGREILVVTTVREVAGMWDARSACRILVTKLLVVRLIRKFLTFSGTPILIFMFTRISHYNLYSAQSLQHTPSIPTFSVHFNIVLPSTWTGIAQSVYRLSYGLDGHGIKSKGGREFSHLSRPALGPTLFPIQLGTGCFPGAKRPGRGVDNPPHLAPRLKKEYICTPTTPLGLRGLF